MLEQQRRGRNVMLAVVSISLALIWGCRRAATKPVTGALQVVRADDYGTAIDGVYPAGVLAAAYGATKPWGTILLGEGTYVSPFYDPTRQDPCGNAMAPYASPRRFVGVGRPGVDDERDPQRLIGGTVILGEICGKAALQLAHLGVDAGPALVRGLYHGFRSDGIYLPSHGAFNPKRGTRLEDVSVLTNDAEGQHSVLIEGEEGAVVDGLWLWTPGGTHGLILKSSHSLVRNFHCKGATKDCLLVKSDYMTAGNANATDDVLEEIYLSSLKKPGDTGGIMLDSAWDTVSRIEFRDVDEEDLMYGFASSNSWFHHGKGLQISGWKASGMAGPCTVWAPGTEVVVRDAACVQPAAGNSVRPISRSFMSRCRDMFLSLKPQLRILWETVKTWCVLFLRWIVAKMSRPSVGS